MVFWWLGHSFLFHSSQLTSTSHSMLCEFTVFTSIQQREAVIGVGGFLWKLTCDGWAHQVWHCMQEIYHAERWWQRGGPHNFCGHYWDQSHVGTIEVAKSTSERHEQGKALKHWEAEIAEPIQSDGKEVANVLVVLQTPMDLKTKNECRIHSFYQRALESWHVAVSTLFIEMASPLCAFYPVFLSFFWYMQMQECIFPGSIMVENNPCTKIRKIDV